MPKVHIGKKIREIFDNTSLTVVEFAKSINLTRNGAYKVFEKATIDTGQLQKISEVLNHDFFSYYQVKALAKEPKNDVVKNELADITLSISKLTKAVERMEERLLASKPLQGNLKKKNGKR